jgi:hypothetical protein
MNLSTSIQKPDATSPSVLPVMLQDVASLAKIPAAKLLTDVTPLVGLDPAARDAFFGKLGWERIQNPDGSTKQWQVTADTFSQKKPKAPVPLGDYGTGQAFFPSSSDGSFQLWTLADIPMKADSNQKVELISMTPSSSPGGAPAIQNVLSDLP